MDTKPLDLAFIIASDTANQKTPPVPLRQRWQGQREWDRENMVTESTQFPRRIDEKLRKMCREDGINRSRLISYMLLTWMAERSLQKEREKNGHNRPNEPIDGDRSANLSGRKDARHASRNTGRDR